MGSIHNYCVTLRRDKGMYLPLFCALIEKAVIDSGYKFEHFSKTIPDPLNGVFDFYISGKRSIIKKAGLEKNLRPY